VPSFPFTQAVLAGATYLPLDGWQYEYLPFPARCDIGLNATAVGVVGTVTSGSDTLMEEAPVQAGGVAGVIPSPLNTPFMSDERDNQHHAALTCAALTTRGRTQQARIFRYRASIPFFVAC
jgi:hypothetical protein